MIGVYMKVSMKRFQKFLDIEKEKQKAMVELSEILGFDISFSNEEMLKNAEENFVKNLSKQISEEFSRRL